MQRIIVNEGRGPRPRDLRGSRLTIGATPDCDVVLGHPGAQGSQFVIEGTATGHRVVVLLGEVLLNDKPCDVADLQHNDTLRVGDSMVLYKNPDARRPAAPPAPAERKPSDEAKAPAAPENARELGELEELEELEALETLEELAELEQLEELAELDEPEELDGLDGTRDREARGEAGARGEPEPRAGPEAMPAARESATVGQPAHVAPVPSEPSHPVLAPAFGGTSAPDVPEDLREALAELQDLIEDEHLLEPHADPASGATATAVRFTRPLPPGHAAPDGPPPPHPGRPHR